MGSKNESLIRPYIGIYLCSFSLELNKQTLSKTRNESIIRKYFRNDSNQNAHLKGQYKITQILTDIVRFKLQRDDKFLCSNKKGNQLPVSPLVKQL